MHVPIRRRGSAALAAATAGAVVAAIISTPAHAATGSAPPWEPDPAAVGTIAFYDASGNIITSGSTNAAPFAAYAVGSTAVHSGDVQAVLNFANPDPSSQPVSWYREYGSAFAPYPLTSGPADVKQLSQTQPVATGSAADQTLDAFEADSVISSQSGYQHVVQVRLRTADTDGKQTTTYDDADLLINPTSHTWTQIYPGNVTPTSTTLTASPNPAKQGAAVTLTATETPATPGSVQFKNGATNLGSPVSVNGSGVATKSVSGLSVGSHTLSATFTPTDPSFTTSSDTVQVTIKTVAHPSTLEISAPKAVTKGAKATIGAHLLDSTTNKAIAHQSIALYDRAAGTKKWRLVQKASTSRTGRASDKVKVSRKMQFQWRFGGNAAHKAVTSATKTVKVK